MPYTDEWRAIRILDMDRDPKVIIGASEAAAAMGRSPWDSRLSLYLKKRGDWREEKENDAMRMGTALEPVVLDEYDRRMSVSTKRQLPMYFSDVHHCIAATPDGLLDDRCVDAKTSTHYSKAKRDEIDDEMKKFGDDGTDVVPATCYIQGQQQCFVMNVNRVDFPVLFDGRTLRIYTVWRNESVIELMIAANLDMVRRIVTGDPPEADVEHEVTQDALRLLFPVQANDVKFMSDEAESDWERRCRLKYDIKEMEREVKLINNQLRIEMGRAEFGRLPNLPEEIHRISVSASEWTEDDIEKARKKLGTEKRRSYDILRGRKAR